MALTLLSELLLYIATCITINLNEEQDMLNWVIVVLYPISVIYWSFHWLKSFKCDEDWLLNQFHNSDGSELKKQLLITNSQR